MTKKGKKVIIIDDDEIFLETLANVLKLSDLDVYQEKTAESGFEAIVNIEPDLVLLKVVLKCCLQLKKAINFIHYRYF